ncbi:phage antirepressor KilAC domain-containing protein [Sporosarcina obsidiansis]|uniref:phage antirepressor KilAC domain-containing protein n=1 Tax=Sporosarcina obsidiansis TaxID=2660748 RepID=UPI00129BB3B4|nr:phage antirepressor KilAC domain-containing protein [Sporosarcina obsidiansis]
MNELIPTSKNENGNILVSGRDLYTFLEVKEKYTQWFTRMLDFGFIENVDYMEIHEKVQSDKRDRTYEQIDHHIKVDMAKELSMLQRNEKGKQARLFFLDLERKWNSPEMVIKRAQDYLIQHVDRLESKNFFLERQVQEYEKKATYYDTVMRNKSLLTISVIAKDYGMGAVKMNRLLNSLGVQYKKGDIWLLYAKYQTKGYTQTSTHIIDADNARVSTKWTQKGRLFIYELLKENGILPVIEKRS